MTDEKFCQSCQAWKPASVFVATGKKHRPWMCLVCLNKKSISIYLSKKNQKEAV